MPSSNRPTIRVNCPQCLAQLDIDSQQAGQRAECPQCHFSLLVPAAGTAGASLFDDLLDPSSQTESPRPSGTAEINTSRPPFEKKPASNPLQSDFDFDENLLSQPELSQAESTSSDAKPVRASKTPPASPQPGPPIPEADDDDPTDLSIDDIVSQRPGEVAGAKSTRKPDTGKQQQAKQEIPSEIDDDLELDLKLEPVDPEVLSAPIDFDPTKVDPNAPIRVEGIESGDVGAGSIPVKCKVCDSVLHASAEMLGKNVVCPDCGSRVLVVKSTTPKDYVPTGARANKDWREVQEAQDASDYRLAAPIDRASEPVQPGWGLPNQRADSMNAIPALEPIRNEDGEDILEGAATTRRVDPDRIASAPFAGGRRAAEEQTRKRIKNPVPTGKRPPVTGKNGNKNRANTIDDEDDSLDENGSSGTARQTRTTGDRSRNPEGSDEKRGRSGYVGEDDDERRTGEKWTTEGRYVIKLEELGAFKGALRGWLKEVLKDRELWIRSAVPVFCLGFTYWMASIVVAAIHAEDMNGAAKVMQIVFPGFFGGICLIVGAIVALMTGSLVFQQSGDRRPRISEWPGFGVSEWGGSALFWGFGIWIGSLPGILVGLVFALSKLAGFANLSVSLSAVLLGPPLLLAAWYNGSAFQVYSGEVLKQFRGGDTDWLRYLPGSIASWLLIAIGYGLTWLPVPPFIISFVAAALQVAGIMLFATTSGLYCGLMARKIERGE